MPFSYPAILQAIENNLGVELVAATSFGSHARGCSLPTSDHDVAFIFKHRTKSVLELNPHLRFNGQLAGQPFDVQGVELRPFVAALADANPHSVLMLYGQKVHNDTLINDLRVTLMQHARHMVVHKMATAARGTFKAQRKENEIVKANLTSLWMFVQVLMRCQPRYDRLSGTFMTFGQFVDTSPLPTHLQGKLHQHLDDYVEALTEGKRSPLTQSKINAVIEALDWFAQHYHYQKPALLEPTQHKHTKGDETVLTRAFAELLEKHGEL